MGYDAIEETESFGWAKTMGLSRYDVSSTSRMRCSSIGARILLVDAEGKERRKNLRQDAERVSLPSGVAFLLFPFLDDNTNPPSLRLRLFEPACRGLGRTTIGSSPASSFEPRGLSCTDLGWVLCRCDIGGVGARGGMLGDTGMAGTEMKGWGTFKFIAEADLLTDLTWEVGERDVFGVNRRGAVGGSAMIRKGERSMFHSRYKSLLLFSRLGV